MRPSANWISQAPAAIELEDVTTCPGAYSCNLALTKSMNLGAALSQTVRQYDDSGDARLPSRSAAAPTPAASTGFRTWASTATRARSTARKSPTTRCCSAAATTPRASCVSGWPSRVIPARLAPEAVQRVLEHLPGESSRKARPSATMSCGTRWRFFRQKIADLAKPAELFPEIYQDWGDDDAFSLQLGRGECAA